MAQAGVLARPEAAAPFPGPLASEAVGSRRGLLLAILGVASLVTALGLRGHAMWFDELQAWNIARASHSLGDLYANLRYEGHPIVWYLPLFAITRFTGNPHAMQVLQWVIATGTMALVLFRAPFAIPLRVAVLAGYFFAFEYGVITRSYGLSALLLVASLVVLARPNPRWRSGGVMLGLLAFTSLPGAVLAVAVAVTVLWVRRTHHVFVGAVLAASAVAAATCVPPSDFSNFAPGLQGSGSVFGAGRGVHLASAVAGTWRALVPIPTRIGAWNSNLLDGVAGGVWIQAFLAVVLAVVVWSVLRGHRFARCLWLIGSIGYVGFFAVVILPEHARYAGFVLLLFVAAMWCADAPPGEPTAPSDVRSATGVSGALFAVAVFVLAAQIVATLSIWPIATATPFSRDQALAEAIRSAGLERAIVSGDDWDGTTVGGYLDRPVYSVVRGEWIRYFVHDAREARQFGKLTDTEILCTARDVAERQQRPVAVVVGRRIGAERPVATADGAAVYRVLPRGAPAC